MQSPPSSVPVKDVRFFCGGIGRLISSTHLAEHFQRFGTIVECQAYRDRDGIPLGYGFIEFDAPHPEVMDHEHIINGIHIDVKRPNPRNSQDSSVRRGGPRGGGGGASQHRKRSRSYSSSSSSRSRSRSRSRGRDSRRKNGGTRHSSSNHQQQSQPVQQAAMPLPAYNPALAPVAVPSGAQHHQPPLGTGGAAEVVVCIPYGLCPPAFVADSRVFLVNHDPQTGSLSKVRSGL